MKPFAGAVPRVSMNFVQPPPGLEGRGLQCIDVERPCPVETAKLVDVAPVSQGESDVVGGWKRVRVTFDTGAGESVAPKGAFPGVKPQESIASKQGLFYRVANGKKVWNEGELRVNALTNEFQDRNVTFQACSVTKPLFSGAQASKAGFRTVLDEDGSYMDHKATGQRTALEEENGVYVFYLWVWTGPGFVRPGIPYATAVRAVREASL